MRFITTLYRHVHISSRPSIHYVYWTTMHPGMQGNLPSSATHWSAALIRSPLDIIEGEDFCVFSRNCWQAAGLWLLPQICVCCGYINDALIRSKHPCHGKLFSGLWPPRSCLIDICTDLPFQYFVRGSRMDNFGESWSFPSLSYQESFR